MNAGDFTLSEFLPYRLSVLSERVSRRLSVVYGEKFGLSIPEWRVIVHLARCEKVSVREIHRCVNMEKPRVSRAVAKLVAAGLVEKSPHITDQRLVEISLTPAGSEVLAAIVPEALRLQAGLLAAFTEAEARTFDDLVERLHAALDADPAAPRRPRMDVDDDADKGAAPL